MTSALSRLSSKSKGEATLPHVTLDGTTVDVPAESTILDAAQRAGIWIPTLCHHPAVSCSASCRICMVELDRGDWRQLVTACNYPVRRDLTVSVSGARAVAARQGVMQLLLARSPECEQLAELARRMGVEGTDLPTVTESQRNCILCGLCVQVCEEVMGASAIGFAGRGPERVVATPFRQPSETCSGCGACAAICPVGTITVRIHEETSEVEISPFKSRVKLKSCGECGARLVSEPVAAAVRKRISIDWESLRRTAELCPKCRRLKAARGLSFVVRKEG